MPQEQRDDLKAGNAEPQPIHALDYAAPERKAPVPTPIWMLPAVAADGLPLLVLVVFAAAGLMDGGAHGRRAIGTVVWTTLLVMGVHYGISRRSRLANYAMALMILLVTGMCVVAAGDWRNPWYPIACATLAMYSAIAHVCLARMPRDR